MAARRRHLPRRNEPALRVHRHALYVVVVPAEEELPLRRAIVHNPNRGGVVRDAAVRGVEEVVRHVGQAAVPVHKLEPEPRARGLGRLGRNLSAPIRRRVNPAPARPVLDAALERVVAAALVCPHLPPLHRPHAVRRLQQNVCKQVVRQPTAFVLAILAKDETRLLVRELRPRHAQAPAHTAKLPLGDEAERRCDVQGPKGAQEQIARPFVEGGHRVEPRHELPLELLDDACCL
mmetsp:Transcript_24386/g.79624  ORF Transcript_24386/g.79624 Transcript_24386/m.79624 type:complete len:234 (-) Transcript_24386:229-930(-)